MADNHQITEGSGTTFRSTDNAGVKIPHQAIATATGTPLDTNAGAASASTLRVIPSDEALQDLEILGQGGQLALNQNIALTATGTDWLDVRKYKQISIQIAPAAGTVTAGVISFEMTNNPTLGLILPLPMQDLASLTANPAPLYSVAASATRNFGSSLPMSYFRARISTAIAGTTTGVQAAIRLSTAPYQPMAQMAMNSASSSLNITAFQGVAGQLQCVPNQSNPASLNATTRSPAYTGTATITRAANTTPYTAGDVYGAAFTIANIGGTAGFTKLNLIRILFNIGALPAGMGNFKVHIYSAAPPSAIADNGAWTFNSGDRASYLVEIDLGTPVLKGGGTVVLQKDNLEKILKIATGTSLFGYLVTDGAFTPAANSETASLLMMAVEP